jgi:hypothetical protein
MSHVHDLETEGDKIIKFSNFKYLEPTMNKKGGSQEDVQDKIRKGQATTKMLNSVLWDRDVTTFTQKKNYFSIVGSVTSRLQRPPGLRHELSSPAQTLRSWVRIPLEAWMSVCVYSVYMLSCVQVAALRRTDPPSKESYRLCKI